MGILNYIAEQFLAIKLIDILDIAVVSILIYYIIKFIRDRRASKLALGVLMVLIVVIISDILDMRALKFLLSNIVQIGLISLIIIFQPELRSALEKMGGSPFRSIKNAGETKSSQSKHTAINNICEAASELSKEYTGALIVIERSTPLGDIIKTGTVVNADVTVPLLRNIFYNKAPLHDGAVVIKNCRIYAAGCFLPMSTNDDIIKDLGTRHRSAIGMSENSDAVIVVVSEETGTISIAVDGQLKRNYDLGTLKTELSALLGDEPHTKDRKGEKHVRETKEDEQKQELK